MTRDEETSEPEKEEPAEEQESHPDLKLDFFFSIYFMLEECASVRFSFL